MNTCSHDGCAFLVFVQMKEDESCRDVGRVSALVWCEERLEDVEAGRLMDGVVVGVGMIVRGIGTGTRVDRKE